MANLQYIGARYVPKFYINPDYPSPDNRNNDWKAGETYEALTIVTYNNDSYTSKKFVPNNVGDPANNVDYWACTTKYTAALMALQTIVQNTSNFVGSGPLHTVAQTLAGAVNEMNAVVQYIPSFITPQMYGAVADGVTDDTQAVQDAIDAATTNNIVYITPNTVWDASNVTFKDNVAVIDESSWDADTQTFSALRKFYFQTDDPGNKNCNALVVNSNYHPWIGVNNIGSDDYASIEFMENGSHLSDITLLPYTSGGIDYFLLALRNIIGGTIKPIIEAMGGSNGNNEIAFKSVPSPNTDYKFGSSVASSDLKTLYIANSGYGVMFNFASAGTDLWRVTFDTAGKITFNNRYNSGKNIVFLSDGTISQQAYTKTSDPISLSLTPRFIGEEVLDTSTNTWYKSVGMTSADWKAITS